MAYMRSSHARVAVAVSALALTGTAYSQPTPNQSSSHAAPVAAHGIALHSVSLNLPAGDRIFAGGTPAQTINSDCLTCHSAEMVLNQPPLTKSQWLAEVTKMRTTYKAPIGDSDVPAIVDYLVKVPGPR